VTETQNKIKCVCAELSDCPQIARRILVVMLCVGLLPGAELPLSKMDTASYRGVSTDPLRGRHSSRVGILASHGGAPDDIWARGYPGSPRVCGAWRHSYEFRYYQKGGEGCEASTALRVDHAVPRGPSFRRWMRRRVDGILVNNTGRRLPSVSLCLPGRGGKPTFKLPYARRASPRVRGAGVCAGVW
jgi:hypothetical protein